jgi:hypothetical protein
MHRDIAALSLLALIGLSCVGVGSELTSDADSVGDTAMASESGFVTETGVETESGSTSETSSTTSDTGTETGSSSGDTTETSTETSTDTETSTETGMDGPTPDLGVLAILDVNPNSTTFDQPVHPLDYTGQLSGWYFGHAT